MKVKFKKLHQDAVIPKYAKQGDAGMDLIAVSKSIDEFGNLVYGTGLAFELEENTVGLIFPRSSLSKYDLIMSNHVGVLDSGYRGELIVKFIKQNSLNNKNKEFEIGDKIAQLIIIPIPKIEMEEVQVLSESERGSGGFGSTGK